MPQIQIPVGRTLVTKSFTPALAERSLETRREQRSEDTRRVYRQETQEGTGLVTPRGLRDRKRGVGK